MDDEARRGYWRANLRLLLVLLSIWALVSFGFGILLKEPLDAIVINNFPLGFWFAQQGSIYTFVALIAFYVWRMDRLDDEYGVSDRDQGEAEAAAPPPPPGLAPPVAPDDRPARGSRRVEGDR